MLRCIHSVITSSMSVPTHSVSFPLDRSDKDNVAVMVSTIHKFGNSPISAVIWLYLDGCISSAYNSASKGNIMYCHQVFWYKTAGLFGIIYSTKPNLSDLTPLGKGIKKKS